MASIIRVGLGIGIVLSLFKRLGFDTLESRRLLAVDRVASQAPASEATDRARVRELRHAQTGDDAVADVIFSELGDLLPPM